MCGLSAFDKLFTEQNICNVSPSGWWDTTSWRCLRAHEGGHHSGMRTNYLGFQAKYLYCGHAKSSTETYSECFKILKLVLGVHLFVAVGRYSTAKPKISLSFTILDVEFYYDLTITNQENKKTKKACTRISIAFSFVYPMAEIQRLSWIHSTERWNICIY